MADQQHRFQVGQFVKAKASGKFYLITDQRPSTWSSTLKGEIGYAVAGRRDGTNYGPTRLMRESSFELTAYCTDAA